MNWRESLSLAIRQGTSAKDAKAPSVAGDPGLLHLLHTEKVEPQKAEPFEDVLKGLAIELWSDAGGRLFIVADEEDARRLGEPRGPVYSAAEMRRVVQIGDPATVLEIHAWKRRFNGRVREYQGAKTGEGLTT